MPDDDAHFPGFPVIYGAFISQDPPQRGSQFSSKIHHNYSVTFYVAGSQWRPPSSMILHQHGVIISPGFITADDVIIPRIHHDQ